MSTNYKHLPIEERLRLVEEIWDSIASDQTALPLTPDQKAELDRRMDSYDANNDPGKPKDEGIARIRQQL